MVRYIVSLQHIYHHQTQITTNETDSSINLALFRAATAWHKSPGLMSLALMLQKYLSRLFKGALVTGLFAAIFRGQSNNNPTLHRIYVDIIKVSQLSSFATGHYIVVLTVCTVSLLGCTPCFFITQPAEL